MLMARRPVLLVADAPGHIIDRMGRSWLRHGRNVQHQLLNSGTSSSFSICARARHLGVVHFIDQIAFQALGNAVRAPQVVMVHHLTPGCLESGIAALESCDALTTTSIHWQKILECRTGRQVTRIPYSVDAELFRPCPGRDLLREGVGFGPDTFVVGFLGKGGANQENRKGLDVLESVVRAAARRIPKFAFVLIGPGWESLAQNLRQAGVHVVQAQYRTTEETAAAYALMDALLVTSSEEGGPCTILEAMACGVPVVTSVVGHVNEVVRHGQTGFTCPSRSPREYLEALALLSSSTELRRRIAEEARAFVLRERADNVVIARIDFATLYQSAIQRFRTRSRSELALRMLGEACFYARSLARPLVRSAATVRAL